MARAKAYYSVLHSVKTKIVDGIPIELIHVFIKCLGTE